MDKFRYVCISDLHLGAENSLLTNIDEHGQPDPIVPSPALDKFAVALRDLVKKSAPTTPPTLVLLGDVLDLGLSSYSQCVFAFKRFIEAMFPKGEDTLFADEIILVPGNHDHHLWQIEKDQSFLDQINNQLTPQDELIEITGPCLPLKYRSALLTSLFSHYEHLKKVTVSIAYPNFGIQDPDSGKLVIMHHGHFLESTYTLVSKFNAWYLNETGREWDLEELERQNGNWIDFLWSSFGSAGVSGRNLFDLYELMMDDSASHDFIKKVSAGIIQSFSGSGMLSSSLGGKSTQGLSLEGALAAALDFTVGKVAAAERANFSSVLSDASIQNLKSFLSGPLITQLKKEAMDHPDNLSFVFGHTHKPFQDLMPVDCFSSPVQVFNTGGWVLDSSFMPTMQGAAVVFVDDKLNVASLRLFNDSFNDQLVPVYAAGSGNYLDESNGLIKELDAAIAASARAWAHFQKAVSDGLILRRKFAMNRFFDPSQMPTEMPAQMPDAQISGTTYTQSIAAGKD